MKILHVLSSNLDIFSRAVEGTACRINGSCDIKYLAKSLQDFNARDVLGLVVFKQFLTKKMVKMVEQFDELLQFNPKPIVIICDNATALYAAGALRVRNSPLFLVDSIEGTMSDTDLRRIMATVCCLSDDIYDLSGIPSLIKNSEKSKSDANCDMSGLADEVLKELKDLGCEYATICTTEQGRTLCEERKISRSSKAESEEKYTLSPI